MRAAEHNIDHSAKKTTGLHRSRKKAGVNRTHHHQSPTTAVDSSARTLGYQSEKAQHSRASDIACRHNNGLLTDRAVGECS